MAIKVSSTSYDGNTGLKVYIIKQVERENKEAFEKTYSKFLIEQKGISGTLNSIGLATTPVSPQSYLIPLVYDVPAFKHLSFSPMDYWKQAPDAYYYEKGKEQPLDQVYLNSSYKFLFGCPLIDFTKLAYIFQIKGLDVNTGIGDVLSCSTSLNTVGGSNANVKIANRDNYYNINTKYDDLENLYKEDYNKVFFSYPDIIIIRMEKRNPNPNSFLNSFTKTKFNNFMRKDPYSEGDNDLFRTVFTGYIRNIKQDISYSAESNTLTLSCLGPSIVLTERRILMGPSIESKDVTASLIPLSVLGYAQTNNSSNEEVTDTSKVIRNLVTRCYTSIENIPQIKKAKTKFEETFKKIQNINVASDPNLVPLNKNLDSYRNTYNSGINSNVGSFFISSNKGQFVRIWKNAFLRFKNSVPCFQINGTNQPAFQSILQSPTLFTANFQTCSQFIQGLADKLGFNFYDDEFGTIRFELLDSSLYHIQKTGSPNRLNQILNLSKAENIDQIINIQTVWGSWPFASMGTSESVGIGAAVRLENLIEKYGERNNSPLSIPGITTVQACKNYAANIMYKHNSKVLGTYNISMVANPEVEVAKYAYLEDFNKLVFLGSVSHNWASLTPPTTSVQGFYERDLIDLKNTYIFQFEELAQKLLDNTNSDKDIDSLIDNPNLNELKSWFDLNGQAIKSAIRARFPYETPALIENLKTKDLWKYYFKGTLWFPIFFSDIFNTSTYGTEDAL